MKIFTDSPMLLVENVMQERKIEEEETIQSEMSITLALIYNVVNR